MSSVSMVMSSDHVNMYNLTIKAYSPPPRQYFVVRLFSLDMIPINGCFKDVLQLWLLFFDVNCRLPPVIDSCFKDVLQQWPLFFIVNFRLSSDVNSRTQKKKKKNTVNSVEWFLLVNLKFADLFG